MGKSCPDSRICKWSRKELERHFSDLIDRVVAQPRFGCTKCGRVASDKRYLCKAKKAS